MKNKQLMKFVSLALGVVTSVSLLASAAPSPSPSAMPEKAPARSGITVYSDTKGKIDASNLGEGYLTIAYTGGKNVRIKLQITKTGGTAYTYDLNNAGTVETFPITEGDGEYTIRILENTTGTKYAQAFSKKVAVALRDPFVPFLYPNQYVNWTEDSATAKKAAELCKDKESGMDKLLAVYEFVIKNFTYDYELAKTVKSGYLPVVDTVLEKKKGICFDYSAVMSAMLRSQGVPCKLVIGYAGTQYHAWVNVYIENEGWIEKAIYFDGKNWSLMDPTYASGSNSNPDVMKNIGAGKDYSAKYAY